MAKLETAESIIGELRQVIQDLVAPELRELRADMRALNSCMDQFEKRMDKFEGRIDNLEARMDNLGELVTRGFEDVRRQLDTYKAVQLLKKRMARMEGEGTVPPPEPSAERIAHGPA